MGKHTLLALVLLGGLGASRVARADEYVCFVGLLPPRASPAFGNYGYLQVSFHSQPGCAGVETAYSFFCSTGATHSSCATATTCGTDYTYSENGLHTLAQMLRTAAQQDQRLTRNANCGGTRGSYVTFSAP